MPSDDQDLQSLARARRTGIGRELIEFLAQNKKWWLLPIVISLLLLGVLVLFAGSAAAPFIYTLF